MQLMCDALAVLGSRHGVLFDPVGRGCGIVRFDKWDALPRLDLRAGAVIAGEEHVLPLCAEGRGFSFLDQRISPCTWSLTGIHAESCVKVKLTAATPFRPRDAEFSTTPVIALRLEASRLPGQFRWQKREIDADEVELFIEFGGGDVTAEARGADAVELRFPSVRSSTRRHVADDPSADAAGRDVFDLDRVTGAETLAQVDRVVAPGARAEGGRLSRTVSLDGAAGGGIEAAWCTHSGPVLEVLGEKCPFRYASRFDDLDAVADWARRHSAEIWENAARVDGIVGRNSCSKSVNNLLALTLHSWLINTWWVDRSGRDWFSVWEGNCYYHSTVDVEFTQTPFYLSVWPELQQIELDFWPEFSKDGAATLGERGAGTRFLSHDTGSCATACGQDYGHEMEVEETTNYVIMSWCHYRRTGDPTLIERHGGTIRRYLEFLALCDTTGDGVPDAGVANTIDDASPAVQYGREQTYLAVKTLAAFAAGAGMMELLGDGAGASRYAALAGRLRAVIEEKGWLGDHFATLLEKRGERLWDPWSGNEFSVDEVPGWDAPHIYTENCLGPLDMVGFDLGLDPDRLAADLRVAAERCLREYGCVHTDFANEQLRELESMHGLAGASRNPGWISMNMLRDIAAFYRGVDLRHLADRYWEWQTVTNSQEPKIFFETFSGNNLSFYPRGVAVWGYFEALAGLVIDRAGGVDRVSKPLPQVRVPRLYDADWVNGTCVMMEG